MKLNKSSYLFLYSCLVFANTDIYIDVSQDTIFVGDKIQVTLISQNYEVQKIEFPKLDVDNEDLSLFTISTGDTSLAFSLQFWRVGIHNFPSIKIQTFNDHLQISSHNFEMILSYEGASCKVIDSSWHQGFGNTIPNKCIELSLIKGSSTFIASWKILD